MSSGTLEPDEVPANERRVRQGGLMRCCIGTIDDSTEPTRVGTTLSCKYEPPDRATTMVVALDGIWEWQR